MAHWLIVAAVAEELGTLPGLALGVGPVRAAAGMARALAERSPAGVVLVGSAGAYPRGPAVGSVVAGRRLGWADGASAAGLAYAPLMPPVVEGAVVPGVPPADVLTLPSITTDPGLVRALALGWQVEHLEAYAVAWACREAGIPCAVLLGISNEVGPDAHAQWRTHRGEAEAAARAEAIRHLAVTELG